MKPRRTVWLQLRRRPLVRLALGILGVFYLLAAFADFLAPYAEGEELKPDAFHPPTKLHFVKDGRLSWPYICPLTPKTNLETFRVEWHEDCSRTYPLRFFVHREENVFGVPVRYVPFPVNLIPLPLREALGIRPWASLHLFGVDDPYDQVRVLLLGADGFGGDMFGKLLFGARVSLTLGLLAALVAVPLGAALGALAGYFGGLVERLILDLADALTAIPAMYWLMLLNGAVTLLFIEVGLRVPSTTRYLYLTATLALVGWGNVARGVRSRIRAAKEEEFALAALALGLPRWRTLFHHLLPQATTFLLVSAAVMVPNFILLESALSFFKLGVRPPSSSWGLMLAELLGVGSGAERGGASTGLLVIREFWWLWLPGALLFSATFAWVTIGEALRDAFDPRG